MQYKWQLATLFFLYVEIKHNLRMFFVDYVNFTHNLGANILLFSRGHEQAKHFTQVWWADRRFELVMHEFCLDLSLEFHFYPQV